MICFLALFIGSAGALTLIPLASAYTFFLYDFDTDRDAYHVSGQVEINATWDLYFDPALEEVFVQIQIYDCGNDLIWNSSQYNESGSYDESWVVNLSNLSYNGGDKSDLQIKFFQHYFHKITLESMDVFVREKKITIHEDRIECQLDNFKEILMSNEILEIEAKFYDLINSAYIINQEIFFEMLANELKLYEHNFTTNSMGQIELSIDVFSQMSLGNNTLRFSIMNNPLYNNTVFEYSVYVGQSEAGTPLDGIIVIIISSTVGIISVVGLIVVIGIKKHR